MDEQLKRTEEDTAAILLEYIAGAKEEGSQRERSSSKARSRTKSVEKAKAVLMDATSKQCKQQEVVVTETESEGFVVFSTESPNKKKRTCKSSSRPSTLALQVAADPGDPPLFSPCKSCPSPSADRMLHVSQSSPTLGARSSVVTVPSCQQPGASVGNAESMRTRSRMIANRLRQIGDEYERTHNMQLIENDFEALLGLFSGSDTPSYTSLWNITRVFRSLHQLLSQLYSVYGDQPPQSDERYIMFKKIMDLLRETIIPRISSLGGWGSFLPEVMIGSPQAIHVTHSTPVLSQTDQNRRRLLQEYQPSPGSTRSLRLVRSNTLPTKCEHPRKLWSLSESGSLIDEDGNEDFEESLKKERESDFEGSSISLDNAGRIAELANEREDLVFPMETVVPQSPVIVAPRNCREVQDKEYLCDSGIVSSQETLSISSTPPRDTTFSLGSGLPHNDSAVDLNTPTRGRPRSGCSFPSKPKEDLSPFDRARSRSVPMSSRRPRSAGNEKKPKASAPVASSHPPVQTTFNSGSVTLSISEAVLYEAVCSLLR